MIHGLHVLYPEREWPDVGFTDLRLWDCDVYWSQIHTGPGRFDFDRLDWLVDHARARGVENLTYTLAMTPGWLARSHPDGYAPWISPGCNTAPFDLDRWDQFVTAIATRYAGRIGSWQVWNETQLRWFWTGPLQPLAEMTVRAKRIIARIDSKAKVVAAPVLPTSGDGGLAYYRVLRAKGWPVDIYAAHLYPPGAAAGWGSMAREWKRTLEYMVAPARPLWVTETNAWHGRGPMPRGQQAAYMAQVDRQAKRLRIDRVYWYGYGSHSDTSLLGIPLTEGSPGAQWLARRQ